MTLDQDASVLTEVVGDVEEGAVAIDPLLQCNGESLPSPKGCVFVRRLTKPCCTPLQCDGVAPAQRWLATFTQQLAQGIAMKGTWPWDGAVRQHERMCATVSRAEEGGWRQARRRRQARRQRHGDAGGSARP